MSGPPPILTEHQMGSCSRNPSCEAGSPLRRAQVLRGSWFSFATRSACVSAGTAQRATMRGHRSMGGALISAGLRVIDLEVVVQVLAPAAAQRPAGHAWVALAVVAGAADVAARFVGKEDVGAQVDRLRCALEPSPEAGKRIEVHGSVDGNEHIGILRHGFVGRQGAEQGYPQDTRRRPRRPHEGEHGFEQVASRVRHRRPGCERRAVAAACHEAVGSFALYAHYVCTRGCGFARRLLRQARNRSNWDAS